jgi:glycosyl transferase family 25
LLESYDRIRIINLRSREDRRREILTELRRIGLEGDARVAFFDAIAPPDRGRWATIGTHGCYLSHYGVLKEAALAGQSVLLLEDDCDFTDAALTSDWGSHADIFYGGFDAADYSDLASSNIQGAHCMGFSARVVPRLVRFLDELATSAEPAPVDGAYVLFRRANPDVEAEFAYPQVAIQRQSVSDISRGRLDRLPALSAALGALRRLNRERHRRRKMRQDRQRKLSQTEY